MFLLNLIPDSDAAEWSVHRDWASTERERESKKERKIGDSWWRNEGTVSNQFWHFILSNNDRPRVDVGRVRMRAAVTSTSCCNEQSLTDEPIKRNFVIYIYRDDIVTGDWIKCNWQLPFIRAPPRTRTPLLC